MVSLPFQGVHLRFLRTNPLPTQLRLSQFFGCLDEGRTCGGDVSLGDFPSHGGLIPLLDRRFIFRRKILKSLGIAARLTFHGQGLAHGVLRFGDLCIGSFDRQWHVEIEDGQ